MSSSNPLNGMVPKQSVADYCYEETLYVPNPYDDWSDATQELLDALPQVWTRSFLYFLIMFLGISLPWAMLSKIDETGTAKGRLEPKEKTIMLEAPVVEEVAAINVKEGDKVKAGQSLVELKSDLVNAELQQQQSLLEGQQNRLNQLKLLDSQLRIALDTQKQLNQAQQSEKQIQIDQAKQNLQYLITFYELHKQEWEAKVEQAEQAIKYSNIAYKIANIDLKTAQAKLLRYQNAEENSDTTEEHFLEAEKVVKENQEKLSQASLSIDNAHSQLKEVQSNNKKIIQQSQSEIEQALLSYREQEASYTALLHSGKLAILKSQEQLNNWSREMTALETEIAQTNSKIASLQLQLKQRVIRAPIDGVVFQLPVQGKGSVVQPGETIAEIAPEGSPLVIRAQIATSESGSLEKGKRVKIKFDAYPFQDYGVLEGELVDISPTSKVTESEQGSVATYELEIELDRDCIPSKSECIPLRPGDTVTAEVIVRQRHVIDLLITPFKNIAMSQAMTITGEDILHQVKLEWKIPELISGIVARKIITSAAEQAGIEVETEELQQEADRIRLTKQLDSIDKTTAWLEKHGLSLDDFEENIYISSISNKLAQHLFADKVEAYFFEHQLDYLGAIINEVVLDDEDLAIEIFYAIQEGEMSFYDVAHEYIQEPELRRTGGYRGIVHRQDMKRSISAAVFAAKPPEIIEPIITNSEVHLILVEEIIKPQLDDTLRSQIVDNLFSNWLNQQIAEVKTIRHL